MKEYAVNIRRAGSDDDWQEADQADWFEAWNDAFEAAEGEFEDAEVEEVMLAVYEDGDIVNSPLHMVREDGGIHQYQDGERLWA